MAIATRLPVVPRVRMAVRGAPEVLLLLVLTAIIRLLLLNAQSGWLDESISLLTAQAGWRGLFDVARSDLHPLLYYYLLRTWLVITGFGLVRARLLSTCCDVVTVVVLYSLTRRLFDRATATVTALLFALSPVAIWYAATARMYALTELLTLVTVRLLVEAYRTQRRRYWIAFGVCGGLAINADYSGIYLVGACVLWYLILVVRRSAPLQPLILGIAVFVVVLLPAAAELLIQTVGAAHALNNINWITAPTPASVAATLGDLVSQNAASAGALWLIGSALVGLSLIVCSRDARDPRWRAVYLLLACMVLVPLVVPLLESVMRPVFITRQVMTALFGMLILFGRGIVLVWRRWRPIALAALALLILLNVSSLQVMASTQLTEDWRRGVPYVLHHSSGKTLLVFHMFYYNAPFMMYAGAAGATMTVDWPPDADPKPGYYTVWLIDVDQTTTPYMPKRWSTLGLRLTDQYHVKNIAFYRFTR